MKARKRSKKTVAMQSSMVEQVYAQALAWSWQSLQYGWPSPLGLEQDMAMDGVITTEEQDSLVDVPPSPPVLMTPLPPPGLVPPPPGLTQPLEALASRGSVHHRTGDCRPQGCQNGAECWHCHLCPEGEIKLRRLRKAKAKAKSDALMFQPGLNLDFDEFSLDARSAQCSEAEVEDKADMQAVDSDVSTELLPSPRVSSQELPSQGSLLHASGACRPCAWFHKPQGCANKEQCRHCHLCG